MSSSLKIGINKSVRHAEVSASYEGCRHGVDCRKRILELRPFDSDVVAVASRGRVENNSRRLRIIDRSQVESV